jgi:hypothetical protein
MDFPLGIILCKKEKSAHSQSKSADGQLVVTNFNKVKTKVMPWSAQSHRDLEKKFGWLVK